MEYHKFQVIEEQAASANVVQSLPEDVARIQDQESQIRHMSEDLGHYKQELIEARAHKSASDDDLGNVKGQLETLQNQISSLSEEGNRNRKQREELESSLAMRTEERDHLAQLVAKMESAADQDEANKAQIADLKSEIAKHEGTTEPHYVLLLYF